MSRFDWIAFFNEHGIEYNTQGEPNVSAGNCAIRCPFCDSDEDEPQYRYLSVSLEGRGYRCWRNPEEHHGSKAWLVAKLLKCSIEHAHEITGDKYVALGSQWDAGLQELVYPTPEPEAERTRTPLHFPKEFKRLSPRLSARPFVKYLEGRGITLDMLDAVNISLYYCTAGHPYHHRIIFPVYFNGQLVSWQGRSIFPNVGERYKTLSAHPEKTQGMPPAVGPITNYLLWHKHLQRSKADTLFLVEGPFDALMLRLLGYRAQVANALRYGVASTCCFTSSPSEAQFDLLRAVADRFTNKYLLLDEAATAMSLRTEQRLRSLAFIRIQLPSNVKDPGDLTYQQFLKLTKRS